MIASEITIIAEIIPRFTGRDVPISEIAKATGKSERFLKRVLREDIMHFGIAVKSDKGNQYRYLCPDKLVWETFGYFAPMPEKSVDVEKAVNDLFYSIHSEFEAIVMDMLGDRIDRKTLNTMFSYYDGLQEEYHNKLHELLRKEVKNHG